ARATGQLAKTDTLDARVIALFAEAVRPAPRPMPDEQARALGELIARRRQLVDMLGAEQNRRRLLHDRRLQRHVDAHIASLEEALRRSITTSRPSSARPPCGVRLRTCCAPSPASAP